MVPLISPGDLVMINTSHQHMQEDGLYLINLNGALRIKRLQLLVTEKRILIESLNPNVRDEYLEERNIHELTIVGKPVWLGKLLRG